MNRLTPSNPSALHTVGAPPAASPGARAVPGRIEHLFRHALAGSGAHPLLPLIRAFRASPPAAGGSHE
jgi:hypothetical protein